MRRSVECCYAAQALWNCPPRRRTFTRLGRRRRTCCLGLAATGVRTRCCRWCSSALKSSKSRSTRATCRSFHHPISPKGAATTPRAECCYRDMPPVRPDGRLPAAAIQALRRKDGALLALGALHDQLTKKSAYKVRLACNAGCQRCAACDGRRVWARAFCGVGWAGIVSRRLRALHPRPIFPLESRSPPSSRCSSCMLCPSCAPLWGFYARVSRTIPLHEAARLQVHSPLHRAQLHIPRST